MALTSELLRANATTAGLSDDQVSAIVEMSQNDENTVIAHKTSEIYNGLDSDILATSGIQKNGGEKTYDYAKRVIGEFKGQAGQNAGLQSQIAELTKEKQRLEGVIAKGGSDEETKKALQKAQADLQDVQNKYAELNTKYENDKVAHQKELFNVKIDQELSQATAGLKFIANLPETAIVELKKQAIQRVKGYTPEYIDDGNGGKVLSFSQNGVTMRNPETNLKPYTAAELIQKELKTMGVLEVQRVQQGAGSQGGQGGGQGGGAIADLSGARTQNEAYEVLAKQLMSQGLINGSKEFDDAMKKAWADNIDTIKTLPKK